MALDMATCSATSKLCRLPFDTVSSKSKRKLLYGASATTELLVLKSILWASVDGTTLSVVHQLAAWLCFVTKKTKFTEDPLYGFTRFKNIHYALIIDKRTRLTIEKASRVFN